MIRKRHDRAATRVKNPCFGTPLQKTAIFHVTVVAPCDQHI